MVQYKKYKMLHDMTHHTNITLPYSKYVAANKFPEQDPLMIGEIVKLRFRDGYSDTMTPINPDRPEELVFNIITKDFKIVRFDLTKPYRFIAMSLDGQEIVVSTTDRYLEEVSRYPVQFNQYLGLYCTQYYVDNPESEIRAITLRVDGGEPCYSVLVEFFNNNIIRFVLGDECQTIVNEKYDESVNYDGLDPVDHSATLIYTDIDGKTPEDEGSAISMDINGYYPDPLLYLYKFEPLDRKEVAKLRLEVLEDKKIYGSQS